MNNLFLAARTCLDHHLLALARTPTRLVARHVLLTCHGLQSKLDLHNKGVVIDKPRLDYTNFCSTSTVSSKLIVVC